MVNHITDQYTISGEMFFSDLPRYRKKLIIDRTKKANTIHFHIKVTGVKHFEFVYITHEFR